MSTPHPEWVSACEAQKQGDYGPLIALALFSADDVCRCEEPILEGDDFMCRACLHRNTEQVKRATARIREPHQYVPGGPLTFCKQCMRPENDPRHIDAEAPA